MGKANQHAYQHTSAIDVEGIEVFGSNSLNSKLPPGYKMPLTSLQSTLTIKQAAKRFRVSTNTIRSRIRTGNLQACKVKGANGEEWRIFLDGLPEEFLQPAPDLQPSSPLPDINRFLDIIQKQTEKLEVAAGQIGYLKSQLESYERDLATSQQTIKLLTDSQAKNRSWWQRFSLWFLSVR